MDVTRLEDARRGAELVVGVNNILIQLKDEKEFNIIDVVESQLQQKRLTRNRVKSF